MKMPTKFLSAMLAFGVSCVASFSASCVVAQEINVTTKPLKSSTASNDNTSINGVTVISTKHQPFNQIKMPSYPVLKTQYDSYIALPPVPKNNTKSLFRFFTRLNDNLQLFIAWFSGEEKSTDKAMKSTKQAKRVKTVPQKNCRVS